LKWYATNPCHLNSALIGWPNVGTAAAWRHRPEEYNAICRAVGRDDAKLGRALFVLLSGANDSGARAFKLVNKVVNEPAKTNAGHLLSPLPVNSCAV
jgi:hypothetical protein